MIMHADHITIIEILYKKTKTAGMTFKGHRRASTVALEDRLPISGRY